jgi:hypothetical protein
MTQAQDQQSTKSSFHWIENPSLLGLAGGFLFAMGIFAALLGLVESGVTESRLRLALAAAVLLSLGYPLLLYVGTLRKLRAVIERLEELERRNRNS